MDRVVEFVRVLAARLGELERKINADNRHTVDLLEDTVMQSTRALSSERNSYLARIMAESADVSPEQYEFNKKLLQILSELTDEDIRVLKAHSEPRELHLLKQNWPWAKPVTEAEWRTLDPNAKFEHESRSISLDVHRATLERFGLLEPERQRPSDMPQVLEHGAMLQLDYDHIDERTGLPRVVSHAVTPLGRLLLTRLFGTYFD
jgi:hypothetical protein